MNKLIFATTSLIVFITLVLPVCLTLLVTNVPENNQPGFSHTQKVYDKNPVEQKIIPKKDLFSGIGVSIKNPNLVNNRDLLFEVYDSTNTKLRTITINGKYISDGKFVKFFFDPIKESANKEFTLKFLSPEPEKENALEVEMSYQGNQVAYVIFNRPSNLLNQTFLVYKDWFSRLGTDRGFAIFYLVSLSILLIFYLKSLKSNKIN